MGYAEGKRLFENVSAETRPQEDGSPGGCVVGVTVIDDDTGKGMGIPLPVGEKVWLSEREMRLTASGPKEASDSPFVNGDLREVVENRHIPGINDRFIPVEGAVAPDAPPPEPEAPATDPEGLKGTEVSTELPTGALPAGVAVEDEAATEKAKAEEKAAEQAKADDELRASMAEREAAKDLNEAERADIAKAKKEKQAEETAAAEDDHTAEVGTAVKPQGDAPEGEFAKGEEVATPDAPSKGGGKSGHKKG